LATKVNNNMEVDPVVISYNELLDGSLNLSSSIEKAFGENGIGLILISDVPNYPELRNNLLPRSYKFAHFPNEVKSKYEHPSSNYSYGWSHGKEFFKGVPDIYKGSYYNNPQYDVVTSDPEQIRKTPEVSSANIWPTEHLPSLEHAFKALGQLIIQVGINLAHHCDKYIIEKLGDKYKPENYIENIIKKSTTAKGRLLHYFEVSESMKNSDVDNWCGWHYDHDSLTGLTSALYRDVQTGEFIPCPDPTAGLYVQKRTGEVVKIKIPASSIAFQMGESSQILSGGIVRATLHSVKGPNPSFPHVCRDTFAVFTQPPTNHMLTVPESISLENVSVGLYKEGMNFGQFGKAKIENYYEVKI